MDSISLNSEKAIFFNKLVDTHVHFHELKKKSAPIDFLIKTCFKNGFSYFLDIGLHPLDFEVRKTLLLHYDNIFLTAGFHPLDSANFEEHLNLLENIIQNESIIAVGEIGLDYLKSEDKKRQIDLFVCQLSLATKYKKPVILHVREAYEDVYSILKDSKYLNGGIMHCYSGSYEYAKKFIGMGFKVSFAGNITFKNADLLRDVVSKVNFEDMLIETDSPFLAPIPLRGKINSPFLLGYTLLEISKIKNKEPIILSEIFYDNFKSLFF